METEEGEKGEWKSGKAKGESGEGRGIGLRGRREGEGVQKYAI